MNQLKLRSETSGACGHGSLRKIYAPTDVLTAARERIAYIFDSFENVIVSVSGGKDSTVLAHLALAEAHRRGRRVGMYFSDMELIHESTADQVRYLMHLYPEHTIRYWLQVPYPIPNAASYTAPTVMAWDPERENVWMRAKEPDSIHVEPWGHTNTRQHAHSHSDDVIKAFYGMFRGAAILVGLRADESLNRYTAVTRRPGYKDWQWTTAYASGHDNIACYPIYDWAFGDVWRYIHDEGLQYNRIYDYQYAAGVPVRDMRISSLLNGWGVREVTRLQAFEPDTYERLCRRVPGVQTAALYAEDDKLMRAKKLPAAFDSWRSYRDHLLATCPDAAQRERYRQRFARQPDDEHTARQQCRQLLLNDIGGSISGSKPRPKRDREELKNKWRTLLS